ncbi:MAG: hypothetical protein FWF80_05340 [Defluviitaleaceae bacterium]|nr:hypothetical protein [Defluviitaleaceae bacterium]
MTNKFLVAIFLIAALFFASACSPLRLSHIYFDEDYTVTYADVLGMMFGDDWTVVSVESRFDEGEHPCGCGFSGEASHTFYVWTIEYRDGNGDVRTFALNNRAQFSGQIAHHITSTIADYYRENFLDVYLYDAPFARTTRVTGFRVRSNVHASEHSDWGEIAEEYRLRLSTPDGTVRLSEMTPANVFNMFPMYLTVNIALSGDTAHEQEAEFIAQAERMMESMNQFTNDSLNARFTFRYSQNIDLYDGTRGRTWIYARGERVSGIGAMSRYLFDSYIGIFW